MDDRIELNELSMEHKAVSEQGANLLEEIEELDKKLRDPNYTTYKKSTYWHQQTGNDAEQAAFQKELMERLQRIESTLSKIETLFENKST